MARDVSRFFRDEDLVGPVTFAKACKEHHVIVITDDHIYNFNDPRRGREDYKKFIEEAQAAADFLNKHIKMMLKNRDRRALVREHYKTADCHWPLEQLPDRGWESIVAKASKLELGRSYPPRSTVSNPTDMVASVTFSIKDWKFMETNEIPTEIILETRIYWREYVSLPIEANPDLTSRQ